MRALSDPTHATYDGMKAYMHTKRVPKVGDAVFDNNLAGCRVRALRQGGPWKSLTRENSEADGTVNRYACMPAQPGYETGL